MTDNTLNLLGLALRGGNLAVGDEPVVQACRLGTVRLILTAADTSGNTVDRAVRLAQRSHVPAVRLPCSKERLGLQLGRKVCAVLAVTDQGLATALLHRLAEEDGIFPPPVDRPEEPVQSGTQSGIQRNSIGTEALARPKS